MKKTRTGRKLAGVLRIFYYVRRQGGHKNGGEKYGGETGGPTFFNGENAHAGAREIGGGGGDELPLGKK